VSYIDATAPVHVVSHLPEGDVLHPAGGWVWDLYSPQRLMEFEAEVYGRACQGYDEGLAHSFARLGWSMPSSALVPFGVVLELHHGADDPDPPPGLTAMRVPMALMRELAPSGSDAVWSASRRAVITQTEPAAVSERHSIALDTVRSWLADQNRETI